MSLTQNIRNIFLATKQTQAYVSNEMRIFPASTANTINFVAGGANAFGAWLEIVDAPGGNTFSTVFATQAGFLDECSTYGYSDDGELYFFEIAYGAAFTVVARARLLAATAALGPLPYFISLRSAQIPAGEIVYYRMMSTVGGADLFLQFRYYFVV